MKLKNQFKLLIILLYTLLLVIWLVFYAGLSKYLRLNMEKITQTTMDYVLEYLDGRFVQMDQVYNQLNGSEAVSEMLGADTIEQYYTAAGLVEMKLEAVENVYDISDGLMIFNREGNCYVFIGSLTNHACKTVYQKISRMTTTGHFIIELDGTQYIGYRNSLAGEPEQKNGTIVFLLEQDRVLSLISQTEDPGLDIAFAAGGEILVATDSGLVSTYTESFKENADLVISRQVGNTPFEVIVAAGSLRISTIAWYALLVSFAVMATISFALWLFLLLLKRQFFNPVMDTIQNINELDVENEDSLLPRTTGAELNNLVDMLNSMIQRMHQESRAAFESQLLLQNAEIQKQQTEIAALKKHINAHFTVNGLNVVSALNRKGQQDAANRVCEGLSHLIRYAYHEDEKIGLLDELFVISQFVEVMRYSLGKEIAFEYDLDDALYEYRIPRMILQPIIENSIVHGFGAMATQGKIQVFAILRTDRVELTVEDNGQGMSLEELMELREKLQHPMNQTPPPGISHVAMQNIVMRLKALCGDKGELHVMERKGGGLRVCIYLPL